MDPPNSSWLLTALPPENSQVKEDDTCITRCNICLLTAVAAVAAVAAAYCLSVVGHLYL